MAEFLDIEQLATLNGVLLQVVSNYTITSDEESQHDSSASNLRLLEMFLSAECIQVSKYGISLQMTGVKLLNTTK